MLAEQYNTVHNEPAVSIDLPFHFYFYISEFSERTRKKTFEEVRVGDDDDNDYFERKTERQQSLAVRR